MDQFLQIQSRMYLTYNEYTVINNKWQLLPLYMYVCQYNVMYCVSLNLLTVASQPLCCHVDEMEEVKHPNQLSDSEHMSHCMYVFKLTTPLCDVIMYS